MTMVWDIIQMKMIITTKIDTTPTHYFLTSSQMLCPYLQVDVTLLVVPECVRVEEGFVAEGAHQPHPQVYPAHWGAHKW